MTNMRWILGLTLMAGLFLMVTQMSCDAWLEGDDEDCTPAPFDCDETRPTEGDLTIHATINGHHSAVPIWVFRGDFENGDEIFRDTLTNPVTTYTLDAEQYYSVVALYVKTNGDTIVAIDGDDIDVDHDDYCGGVRCYSIDHAEVDVALN